MKTSKIINKKTKKMVTVPRVAGKIKEIIDASGESPKVFRSNFNGYGYQDEEWTWTLESKYFCAIRRILEANAAAPKKAPKTEEERLAAWARRLAKLAEIEVDDAMMIAEDKQAYHDEKIFELENRQCVRYSREREKLISRMQRENPLRRIRDAEHAYAILAASDRHNNTDYESQLEEARELAELGEIDRGDVREYARQNFRKYN